MWMVSNRLLLLFFVGFVFLSFFLLAGWGWRINSDHPLPYPVCLSVSFPLSVLLVVWWCARACMFVKFTVVSWSDSASCIKLLWLRRRLACHCIPLCLDTQSGCVLTLRFRANILCCTRYLVNPLNSSLLTQFLCSAARGCFVQDLRRVSAKLFKWHAIFLCFNQKQ